MNRILVSVCTVAVALFLGFSTLHADPSDKDQDLIANLQSANRLERIIGGSSINNGEWPWLVNIQGQVPATWWWFIVTSYDDYYCGGALISGNWVLTAAHCFCPATSSSCNTNANDWMVKAGDVDRTVTGLLNKLKEFWADLTGSQTTLWWYLDASKIIIHPNYTAANNWMNDMALVKLDKVITLAPADPYVDVITLPVGVPDGWPADGTNCSMQGWGCTTMGGPLQRYAQGVTLPIFDSSICSQIYGNIAPTQLCAGYDLAGKGICKGDSGGPLVCPGGVAGQNWTLAGIASFASADDSGNWPGGFTKASPYVDWITSTINSN